MYWLFSNLKFCSAGQNEKCFAYQLPTLRPTNSLYYSPICGLVMHPNIWFYCTMQKRFSNRTCSLYSMAGGGEAMNIRNVRESMGPMLVHFFYFEKAIVSNTTI